MKRTIFLLAVLAIMAGCKDKTNSELSDGGKITLTGDDPKTPKVDFTAKRISPLMVEFTNESVGYTSYKWDFGDGTWSNGKDALHEFEQAGYDYPVTLTATDEDGNKASVRYEISLTKPEIYFTGYNLYKIPKENKYYKVHIEDSSIWMYETDVTTVYSPLVASKDLPYLNPLNNPVLMVNAESYDYYKFIVYYADKTSESGTSCFTFNIQVSDLLKYPAEIVRETSGTGNTKIGITFGYDY